MHSRLLATIRGQHLITIAVAAGTIAISIFDGGFGTEAYSIAAIVVWAVAIVGLVIGVFPRAPIPRPAIVAGACLAGLGLLTALSIIWASDDGRAYAQVPRVGGYLGLFVLVVLASRDGEGRAWLRGLAIGLSGVGLLAVGSRMLPDVFGSPDAGLAVGGRLAYPIGYWNGLAAMMAGCLALLTWLGTEAPTRVERALAAAAVSIPLLALYLASSRGGILAAVVALGVLVILGPDRARMISTLALAGVCALPLIAYTATQNGFVEQPGSALAADQASRVLAVFVITLAATGMLRYAFDRRLHRILVSRRTARIAAVASAVLALLAFVAADPGKRLETFKEAPTATEAATGESGLITRSGGGRWQFWGTALDAFASEPLRGIGAGEFTYYWNEHGDFGFAVQDAHSLFLESLAELGIAGFALVVGFFGVAAFAGVQRALYVRDGAGSVALALLFGGATAAAVDFSFELPAVFSQIVIVAALLTGSALTPVLLNAPPAPPRLPRRTGRGLALAGAALILGWAVIVASGLQYLTDRAIGRSQAAYRAHDLDGAAGAAQDAIDYQPWSAEPRIQLALVYRAAGDYGKSRQALEAAIDRADEDWRPWRELALTDGFDGRFRRACHDIRVARSLDPKQTLLYGKIQGGVGCAGKPPEPS
ncbi:MAG: O-antigen ligase family protein [Solirubrobacterales bacterium]